MSTLPLHVPAEPPARGARLSDSRLASLRDDLAGVVDTLGRRRADLVDGACIDDYVFLRWLEWRGGTLALTPAGERVCTQYRRDLR